LLESSNMEQDAAADCFLKALAIGNAAYTRSPPKEEAEAQPQGHLAQIVSLGQVDDINRVQEALSRACELNPDANWIVNLTGGNKLMALAAFDYFKSRGACLCYIEQSHPRDLIPLDSRSPRAVCNHPVSIAEFLAGYGFELRRSPDELQQLEIHDERLWETGRVLAEHSTADDLFPFDDKQREKARKKQLEIDAAMLSPLTLPVREALVSAFGTNSQGSIVLDRTNRAGDFVTGGWLEVFVWGLLAKHSQKLGINDVQHGLKPYRPADVEANDLDVAFVDSRLALVMVECKSGRQDHGGASDIIYKVDSVIGQSNALKARAILATTSDFLFDKQQPGELKSRVKELRDLLKLTVVTRDQIQELARDPDNLDLIASMFLK
ncbi:MAG: DUF1887 family CARF protein, partial [Planctomycetota bacterium]